jgi:hypothetical protein
MDAIVAAAFCAALAASSEAYDQSVVAQAKADKANHALGDLPGSGSDPTRAALRDMSRINDINLELIRVTLESIRKQWSGVARCDGP